MLKKRTCPKGSNVPRLGLSGTLLKLNVHKYGKEMLLKIKGGNIVTLLVGPSTPIEINGHQRLQVSIFDYRVGDHIAAYARPDPQRALVYGAGTLRDLDLYPFNQKGLVSGVSQFGDTLTVKFGKTTLVLDTSPSTPVVTAKGKKSKLLNLNSGDTIVVQGIENRRLGEITKVTKIQIVSQPSREGTP